jgi:hypothetical protein
MRDTLMQIRAGIWLAALCTALAGCARSDDPTAPQPKKVYRDAFETPIDRVEIVADGGTIIGAYDAWLVLEAKQPLAARFDGAYRRGDCAPVRDYFARELALQGVVLDAALLDCREYTDESLPFDNGRWIAEDPAADLVYYRVWKYR